MKSVFADTFYYLAILNANDPAHPKALSFSETFAPQIVTTSWVVMELANFLSSVPERQHFVRLYQILVSDPLCTIIPPSQLLFERAIDLYSKRYDKEWSLTDCISFLVMQENNLNDALTGDHHFEQAGFKILLGE